MSPGSHLPVRTSTGLDAVGQAPLTNAERATLAKLAVEQGFVAPALTGGFGAISTAVGGILATLWAWGRLPIGLEDVAHVFALALVVVGTALTTTAAASAAVRMLRQRRTLQEQGLPARSVQLLRHASWAVLQSVPARASQKLSSRPADDPYDVAAAALDDAEHQALGDS